MTLFKVSKVDYKTDKTQYRSVPKMRISSLLLLPNVLSDLLSFNKLGNTIYKFDHKNLFNRNDEISVQLQLIQFMMKLGKSTQAKYRYNKIINQKPELRSGRNRLRLYLLKA